MKSILLPLTIWLTLSSYCPVRDSLLSIAEAELGVIEVTENDAPRIRQYLGSCDFYVPAPWCACFINWCYSQLGLQTPRYPARAASWTELNRIEHTRQVHPGDIGTIYYSNLGRVGHAFIVEATDADNVYSIEGNTKPYSVFRDDRDGDRVMRKIRPWATVYRFSNWIGDRYHIIHPGENLYRIALKYGVTVDELKVLNGLRDNFIRVGDVLTVECS